MLPTENPDQLALFKLKKIDAAWTVEPWVSRLEMEAGGKAVVEDKDSTITVLVTGVKFLADHSDIVAKFVAAHRELTAWIQQHPAEAQKLVEYELTAETRGKISPALIAHAWDRIVLTNDVSLRLARKICRQRPGRRLPAPGTRSLPDPRSTVNPPKKRPLRRRHYPNSPWP